jgi:hypothetical protein
MPLIDTLAQALSWASRKLGLDTVDAFPPGHAYARTRWNRAYFDVPSDMPPDEIERTLCDAIANTPTVFAHIVHPTPRMQRTFVRIVESHMRKHPSHGVALGALLVEACGSRHTIEMAPGLRQHLQDTEGLDMTARVPAMLAFLSDRSTVIDV